MEFKKLYSKLGAEPKKFLRTFYGTEYDLLKRSDMRALLAQEDAKLARALAPETVRSRLQTFLGRCEIRSRICEV